MIISRSLTVALALSALLGGEAYADFVTFSNPTDEYTGSTTKIPITQPFGTVLDSITDGTLTVAFSGPTTVTQVGPGIFGWGNPPTVEEIAPPVLFSQFQLTRELTFSSALSTFGVEMESNNPTFPFTNPTFRLTAVFYNGDVEVGTIARNLVAPGGARLFAATTTTDVFTRVVLSASARSGGFEFGQVRYSLAAVPEPSSLALFGAASMAGLGVWAVRTKGPAIRQAVRGRLPAGLGI
ncbi:PEP-CTERM sorting domain-containing protein [Paludisphaera soli]|uniref:PEP-CTERM sorting domain-containing protein n=1 Tax=Paludisphaera soli TaxID=2712865 RepID=UPI0013E9D51B|nr:PEP-CTERM sorting domain-containing protein [Paludisphaera soli]